MKLNSDDEPATGLSGEICHILLCYQGTSEALWGLAVNHHNVSTMFDN